MRNTYNYKDSKKTKNVSQPTESELQCPWNSFICNDIYIEKERERERERAKMSFMFI